MGSCSYGQLLVWSGGPLVGVKEKTVQSQQQISAPRNGFGRCLSVVSKLAILIQYKFGLQHQSPKTAVVPIASSDQQTLGPTAARFG